MSQAHVALTDSLSLQLTKFRNGVLVDAAASSTHVFACQKDGNVSYSSDMKSWSEFSLGNGIRISKIAPGASYLLGASDCGRLVMMQPKDGAANALSWKGVNLATPIDGNVVEITHIAAFEDQYIVVVVDVEDSEEGNQNKKPRAAGN